MTNATFLPDWVSAPGETIVDILQERNLSQNQFALLMGSTSDDVKDLLYGRSSITIAVARKLSRILGASVEFWMLRDFQYREDTARIKALEDEWLTNLPFGDMIKFGWLKPVPRPSDVLDACLHYFGVSSVKSWMNQYGHISRMAAFRKSPLFDAKPTVVATWLRQGEIEATRIECKPWDANCFQQSLSSIRSLTRIKDPNRFLPILKKYCADSGVAVAIVRTPSGCQINGATRFLSATKAHILLSFRFLTDDNFWFTFFHEAGHLVLHGKDGFFLEGTNISNKEEEEANIFATQILIPPEYQAGLLNLKADSLKVIKFAVEIGVAPGIIVGQLQHLGKIEHDQLNKLKRYYRWEN